MMQDRVARESNSFLKALVALYSWVHRMDRKFGLPKPVQVPSIHRQRLFAIILLICQTGITFTGALVRVTGSGLGCDTWPQCHPGSLFPVAGAAPWIHQAIEFGNRMLTFVLVIAALVTFISVIRAARRNAILHLAFFQGIGIIIQAVLGGISVRMDLAWWTVAMHFLPSMLLVLLAARLVIRIGEPDDGTLYYQMPRPLIISTNAATALLGITLFTGTLVTGSGPHAGDAAVLPEHRLQVPLVEIAHIHAHSMYLYLGLILGLVAGLFTIKANRDVRKAALCVVAAIVFQGIVGIAQYWMGVPRWTVPIHVIGSGILTALMGFLWSLTARLSGGDATLCGSVEADQEQVLSYDS
ncbi:MULTISPECIES: COX15/CtaA family protein [Corynebacterium]|uniref:COX15/CtaA family protein n=1 Tax=Corynebacterium TaxID=1716 RepID=UPI000A9BCEC1|nr:MULTISPECIES: COX15/CtaA family protein [Corynebacterium]WJY72721.1 Heme A synthase [Corynebacterium auriscanis]